MRHLFHPTVGDDGVEGESLVFSEDINLRPYVGLSLRNALLNLVTLTLYRFWGKTNVRRRVWSEVRMNDEAFEYTGQGRELFIGFLIALITVGLPSLVVIGGAQFLGPAMAALIILPLYLAMFCLFGAAVFLAVRYMASRTVWRGIRFQLAGSPWSYGAAYLGYTLLTGLTLGWFQPAMKLRMARQLWGEMSFGDLRIRWVPRSEDGVYGPFALAWIGAMIGYFVIFGGGMVALVVGLGLAGEGGADPGAPPSLAMMAGIYGLLAVFGLYALAIFAPYNAAILRATVGSLKIGDARLRLDLTAIDFLGLSISNILILVLTLGFLAPLVQARTVRFMVRRITADGLVPLEQARQGKAGPKTGEGLADAFDFSPI